MTAPTLTGVDAPTFDENTVNATPQIIDSNVTLTDPDGDFNGGTLTVSGLLAEDTVSIQSGLVIYRIGADVFYDADGAGGGAAVVIGSVAGGSGATFTATFNGNATTAIVELVIESLTYANSSGAPTAARSLSIVVVDAAGQSSALPSFALLDAGSNPFTGIDVGTQSRPAFADLDSDGDLDLVVGAFDGTVHSYLNTAGVFTEVTGGGNPFDGIAVGFYAAPTFVDVDGDLDLDLVLGTNAGTLLTYENNGGVFTQLIGAANPFDGYDTHLTSPTFSDIDGDGDLDAIVGNYDGTISVLENTANTFTLLAGGANPLDGFDVGFGAAPAFLDIDQDGDLDLLVGSSNFATISTFRNDGGVFTQLTGGNNPFNGVAVGSNPSPTLFDVDADGDQDVVMGGIAGTVAVYTHAPAAGQSSVTVNVTAQNDAPAASGLPTDVTVLEDVASNLNLSAVSLSDVDSGGAITVILTATSGTMTAASGGGVTVSNSGTGAVTLSGTASDIDTFLNPASAILYIGASNVSGNNAATLTVTANDGSGAVALGTVNIDITAVDDALDLSGVAASVTFLENTVNTTPQLLDADVTFIDPDENLDGGTLTVSGLLAEDRISVLNEGAGAGQISIDGMGTIYYGGAQIGNASGGVGATFTVSLLANVTAESVDALIECLTYANVSNTPTASRDLRINVTDASGDEIVGAPNFTDRWGTATTFDGVDTGPGVPIAFPTLGDVDGDGDLDLLVGSRYGGVHYYENVGTAAAPALEVRTGAANPFAAFEATGGGGGTGVGLFDHLVLVDLDDDGDLDLVSGAVFEMRYFENVGTTLAPTYEARTAGDNPLGAIVGNTGAAPTFGDLDGDGDLDMVVGNFSTGLRYFENAGSAGAAAFSEQTGGANPLNGFTVPNGRASPLLLDIDGDGDLDLIVGAQLGAVQYFENTGNGEAPVFVERTGAANPLNSITASHRYSAPAWGDLDGDGDLDLILGSGYGDVSFVENTTVGGRIITVDVTAEADGPTAAADTLTYGGGADTISALGGDDVIDGGGGNDSIDGGTGHDELTGGTGDDYLKGGTGADDLFGGTGDDTYIVDDAGDTTDETGGDGTDLVRASLSWTLDADLENLDLLSTGGAINGTGNGAANVLTGNSYANTLSGLGGDDTIVGGGGNDILNGGDDADSLDGGTGNDQLNGGAGTDDLIGGTGNDRLDGGTGADALVGGLGNDVYVIDDAGDTVTEAVGAGTDTVESSVSHSLGATFENLTLTGSGNVDGDGNGQRNILIGNSGANVFDGVSENDSLSGMDGNDTLFGGSGNDLLFGGDGDDMLVGGAGSDRLTGGAGADLFLFGANEVRRSGLGQRPEKDQILDLAFADGDRIDLSNIDANALTVGIDDAFAFVGKFTRVAGQAVLTYSAGTGLTTLQLDVDGDGKADFRMEINGDQRATSANLYTGGGDANGGWVL